MENELALFAGCGGGILATHFLLGHRIIAAVEINAYRRRVLMQRQNEGVLAPFPIWDDVRTFRGESFSGLVDIVTGGFPCTPWSAAGQRRGKDDARNLWSDTLRIIREVRPGIAFLENVPPLVRQPYFRDEILGGLAEAGYDAIWGVFSAAQVGAPHLRNRLFVLAYARGEHRRLQSIGLRVGDQAESSHDGQDGTMADAQGEPARGLSVGERTPVAEPGISGGDVAYSDRHGQQQSQGGECEEWGWSGNGGEKVAHADGYVGETNGTNGRMGRVRCQENDFRPPEGGDYWTVEPNVGRVAHGVASRKHRLEALGDGQVPLCVAYAYATLFERAFGHRPMMAMEASDAALP